MNKHEVSTLNSIKKKGSFFKIGDIVIIFVVIFIIILLFLVKGRLLSNEKISEGKRFAIITIKGEPEQIINLTKEERLIEIRTSRGYDILRIRDNGIEVIESDCPQKICFTYGLIKSTYESIICLPLQMMITIGSDVQQESEIDAYIS